MLWLFGLVLVVFLVVIYVRSARRGVDPARLARRGRL